MCDAHGCPDLFTIDVSDLTDFDSTDQTWDRWMKERRVSGLYQKMHNFSAPPQATAPVWNIMNKLLNLHEKLKYLGFRVQQPKGSVAAVTCQFVCLKCAKATQVYHPFQFMAPPNNSKINQAEMVNFAEVFADIIQPLMPQPRVRTQEHIEATASLVPLPRLPTEPVPPYKCFFNAIREQTTDKRWCWRLKHVAAITNLKATSKIDLRCKLMEYFDDVLEPELDGTSSGSNGPVPAHPDYFWEGSDGYWYVFSGGATYWIAPDGAWILDEVTGPEPAASSQEPAASSQQPQDEPSRDQPYQ